MVRWGSLKGGSDPDAGVDGAGLSDQGVETLELQEARLKQVYRKGIELMGGNRYAEATEVFLAALHDVALDRDVTTDHRFNELRRIKYLCYKNLAGIAEKIPDEDSVLEWLGEAIALDGTEVSMWYRLGTSAQALRKLHVARCAFERGLSLRPRHTMCLEKLCEVAYIIGDLDTCVDAASRLLGIEPHNARVMFLKGLALSHSDRTRMDGEDIMDMARDLGPLEEEDHLRELRAKRRKVQEQDREPREVCVERLTWRCVLEKVQKFYMDTLETVCKSGMPLNIPVNVRIMADHAAALKEKKAEGEKAICFQDIDALCDRCGGDDEDGDELLLCNTYETCGYAIHRTCHQPPMSKVPEGDWACPGCSEKNVPRQEGETASILAFDNGGGEAEQCATPVNSSLKKRKLRGADSERKDGERKSRRAQEAKTPRSEFFTKFLELVADAEEEVRREAREGNELFSPQRKLAMQHEDKDKQEQKEREEADVAVGDIAEECDCMPDGNLSRFQMISRLPDVGAKENDRVKEFLASLPSPCGLIELVRATLHKVSVLASQERLRGKVLESLLDLDKATQGFFSFQPEAALALAELHFDAVRSVRAQARPIEEAVTSQDVMCVDEPVSGEAAADNSEAEKQLPAWYARHLDGLSSVSLDTFGSRVRLCWIQARVVQAEMGVCAAMPAYERVRNMLMEAPADGGDFLILLPSCVFENCVTIAAVDKCLRMPTQALAQVNDNDRLAELEKRKKDVDPSSAESGVIVRAYDDMLRNALIPEVDREGRYLVTALMLSVDGKQSKVAREERDDRLLKLHHNRLASVDGGRDALYCLNLFLADVVGLESPAGELTDKEENSLFEPLDADSIKRAQAGVQLVTDYLAHSGSALMSFPDPFPSMLRQLQVQFLRVVCRIGATRGVSQLFFQACVAYYQLHTTLAPVLEALQKIEMLSCMFEEMLKRNVHNYNNGEFMRTYLQVLNELHSQAQNGEGECSMQGGQELDEADEIEDDDDDDDMEEDLVEKELAKCYYVMFGLRVRGFKEVYQDVDCMLGKDEDMLRIAGKSREAAKNKPISMIDKELCLDVFTFVQPRIAKALDRQKTVSGSYKEVLETLVSVFPEPPADLAFSRTFVTSFLSPDTSRPDTDFSTFVSRIMTFLQDVPKLPENGGPAAVDVTDGSKPMMPAGHVLMACGDSEPPNQADVSVNNVIVKNKSGVSPCQELCVKDVTAAKDDAMAAPNGGQGSAVDVVPMDACSMPSSKQDAESSATFSKQPAKGQIVIVLDQDDDDGDLMPCKPSYLDLNKLKETVAAPPPQSSVEVCDLTLDDLPVEVQADRTPSGGNLAADIKLPGALSCQKGVLPASNLALPAAQRESSDSLVVSCNVTEGPSGSSGTLCGEGLQHCELRLLPLYADVYSLLARCHQKSGHQNCDERSIQPFLMDLWIHPKRLSSWIGLASCYNSLLHTNSTYGIRFFSTLEHSLEARQMLFMTVRAYTAALQIDDSNISASIGLGLMLFLLLQNRRKQLASDQQLRRAGQRAIEEFTKVLEAQKEWRTAYFLGKLEKKLGKPEADCLEHLFLSAKLNNASGSLGFESFYKLQATRAKLLLDCFDGIDLLEKYSVANCIERANDERDGGESDDERQDSKLFRCVDSFTDAAEEQARYEEAVGGLCVGASASGREEAVLRDVMIALRAVMIQNKNSRWHWAKGRYRLAKLMADSVSKGRYADVSKEIVSVLKTLFFSDKDPPQASVQYFDDKFMQMRPKEAEQATFSNLSSHMRLKLKCIELFSEHMSKNPCKDTAERMEKLLDLLIKADKPSRVKDKGTSPISMVKAIRRITADYFQVLQSMLLGQPEENETELFSDVFKKVGKLWIVLGKLAQEYKDALEGLRLSVHDQILGDQAAKDGKLQVTLSADGTCPVGLLTFAACEKFCVSRSLPLVGRNIAHIIKTVWQNAFGEKKTRLSLSGAQAMRGLTASSTSPRAPSAPMSPSAANSATQESCPSSQVPVLAGQVANQATACPPLTSSVEDIMSSVARPPLNQATACLPLIVHEQAPEHEKSSAREEGLVMDQGGGVQAKSLPVTTQGECMALQKEDEEVQESPAETCGMQGEKASR